MKPKNYPETGNSFRTSNALPIKKQLVPLLRQINSPANIKKYGLKNPHINPAVLNVEEGGLQPENEPVDQAMNLEIFLLNQLLLGEKAMESRTLEGLKNHLDMAHFPAKLEQLYEAAFIDNPHEAAQQFIADAKALKPWKILETQAIPKPHAR